MSTSYNDLMRQVENLRAENSHLRRELKDNSSHLSKLENDSHSMHHVLKSVHSMQDGTDPEGGHRSRSRTSHREGGRTKHNQQHRDGRGSHKNANGHARKKNGTPDVFHHQVVPDNDLAAQRTYGGSGGNNTGTILATDNETSSLAGSDHENNSVFDDGADGSGGRQGEELSKLSDHSGTLSIEPLIDNDSSGHNDSNEGPMEGGAELDQNSNNSADEGNPEQNWLHLQTQNPFRAITNKTTNYQSTAPIQKNSQGDERHTQPDQVPRDNSRSGGGKEKSSTAEGSSGSPTGESPLKKRVGGNRELYNYIQELDQERNALVTEIENEDLRRRQFYSEIDNLTHKLDSLPVSEGYNLQYDMSRRQLEYEMQCLHEMMQKELGSVEQISQRHDARLHRIRVIENEMLRMQQQYREQMKTEREKRDSGTCDHLEAENDGVVVIDACTNTNDAFIPNASPHPDEVLETSHLGQHHSILHHDGSNGQQLSTIATQTPDAYLPPDLVTSTTLEADKRVSNQNLAALYHGAWPLENVEGVGNTLDGITNQDTASVMSFNSSNATNSTRHGNHRQQQHASQQLGTKVEMVYSLLSMLGTHDKDDMSRTLLAMSSSQDSCIAMRQSGCLPLLIQLLHGSDSDNGLLGKTRGSKPARARAAAALHNIVHSHPDDKRGRREARVLRLLEQIRAHCDQLRDSSANGEELDEEGRVIVKNQGQGKSDIDNHPGPAIAALMKWSFDEEHRHAICTLGGLQAIAELLQVDYDINGNTTEQYNITMRRYACMALTNLTFGDGTNKAQLCSMRPAMRALVAQLRSPNEDLRQVAASVLRNLSWRADLASKKILREVDSVTALMQGAMEVKKESTLKSILSALWNLSAHCSENKADVCAVDGALAFLVSSLSYKSPSQTLAIIENGGGILRNVSSHIAVREDYRKTLRLHSCLQILLKHLRSPSLTIVSNACGTLWNISARCPEDQKALWELGAVSMLKNLVHSKHKMISMGSAAALKNLLSARPHLGLENDRFSNPNKPGLHIRKQRALEAEIDQNLSETCENMESPTSSPTETRKHDPHRNKYIYTSENCGIYQVADSAELRRSQYNRGPYSQCPRGSNSLDTSPLGETQNFPQQRSVSRSGSQDSVGSVHSDISHDRTRVMLAKSNKLLQDRHNVNFDRGERRRDSSRDSSHSHKHNDSSSDRGNGQSRIAKVMQEVVQHAETDSSTHQPLYRDGNESHTHDSSHSRSQSLNRSLQQQDSNPAVFTRSGMHRSMDERDHRRATADRLNNSMPVSKSDANNLSSLSNRMEKIHLSMGDDEEEEQPINYSMKYADEQNTPTKQQKSSLPHSQSSPFVKPPTKVDNYVGGIKYNSKSKKVPKQEQSASFSKANTSGVNTSINAKANTSNYSQNFDDADEGPTNYSMKYAEEHEDDNIAAEDQPINFSSRYQEEETEPQPTTNCADCKLVEARRTNEMYEQNLPDEDTVKMFCTEGTPLNFMSTATSMTDLSSAKSNEHEEPQAKTNQIHNRTIPQINDSPKDELKTYAVESEHMSHSDNTGSTVVYRKQEMDNIQNNNISPSNKTNEKSPESRSGPPSQPSLYSYNDTSSSSSPSEKPKQYAVEGTPMSFSRVSSLSSLGAEALEDSPTSSNSRSNADSSGLQRIDENDSLDISSQNVTLKEQDVTVQESLTPKPENSGSTPGKSVTFDETNQVQEIQETPLMFSRCSSLGSLSSFDAHSVHSSVLSEYSRRTSGAVSPSDLPDSPSDTMPPTPSQRKSPTHHIEHPQDIGKVPVNKYQHLQQPTIPEEAPLPTLPKKYATEGSPDFSCATSLSALTIDDEPKIQKETNLSRIPLGEEDGMSAKLSDLNKSSGSGQSKSSPSDHRVEEVNLDESEDNSEVSESDEKLLDDIIQFGMPTASSKPHKDKKIYKKPIATPQKQPQMTPTKTPNKSLNSTYTSTIVNTVRQQQHPGSHINEFQGPTAVAHLDMYEGVYDTPKKFATEGTPLNFSTANSLSDISDMGSEANSPEKKEEVNSKQPEPAAAEEKSDLSSLGSDSEDDDLLSGLIESAMPKHSSRKPKVSDRQPEKRSEMPVPKQHQQPRFQYQGFKKPTGVPAAFQPPRHIDDHPDEAVHTYAVEGTPINFSRATSPFSELNVDMAEDEMQSNQPETVQSKPSQQHVEQHKDPFANNVFIEQIPSYPDSPKHYGVEGTPISYSRNDSLSDLSCEEDAELDKKDFTGTPKPTNMNNPQLTVKGSPVGKMSPGKGKNIGHRKTGIQSPAITRLKTPSKSFKHEPSMHSTPMTKHNIEPGLQTPPAPSEEQPMVYAVEGTPDCFSRNSSLSSLDSDDHEGLANQSGGSDPSMTTSQNPHDKSKTFKVEDTPANLSGSSPLSSLSVESLSFEPTLEESALLEECINAAMPKSSSKSKKRKDNPPLRTSPTGAARNVVAADKSLKSPEPKNVNRPQAETVVNAEKISLKSLVDNDSLEKTTSKFGFNTSPQEISETSLLKHEKEACNQERQQSKSPIETSNQQTELENEEFETTKTTTSITTADMFDLDDENMQDIEIDANKLAETFQELENKFAELGMTCIEPENKNLCLEAEPKSTNDSSHNEHENENGHKVKPIPMTDSMSKSAKVLARLSADSDMQSTESLEMGCKPLSSDSEDGDILQESFPTLSSSLVSNLTTPDLDRLPSLQSSSDNILSGSSHGPSPLVTSDIENVMNSTDDIEGNTSSPSDANETTNITVLIEQDTVEDLEQIVHDSIEENITYPEEDPFPPPPPVADLSAEDERLLEENAKIVLSELSATQDLSHELLDPQLLEGDNDFLIEHETISLVSNDDTSDRASEVSDSLSFDLDDQSDALSEQASEVSSSTTLSQYSYVIPDPEPRPRPRIVKPTARPIEIEKEEEQQHRGIRGRRKALYKSPQAAKPVIQQQASKQIRAGITPPKKSPAVKPPNPPVRKTPFKTSPNIKAGGSSVGKTPPKPPTRTTPLKEQSPSPSRGIPTRSIPPPKSSAQKPKTLIPGSPKSTRKYGINVTPKIGTPRQVQSKINTGIPKASPKTTPERPKLRSEQTVIERPPPPIKQGTFTKDEPTNEDAPTIDSRTVTRRSNLVEDNKKRQSIQSSSSAESKYAAEESGKASPPSKSEATITSRLSQQRLSRASLNSQGSTHSRSSLSSQNQSISSQSSSHADTTSVETTVTPTRLKKPSTSVTGIRKPSTSPASKGIPKPNPKATAAVAGTARSSSTPARTTPQKSNSADRIATVRPGSGLNKSSNNSNSTKTRAVSADSIGKVSSPRGSSVRARTPPRAAILRNDSQSSLNRGSSGSRGSTPSRKSSIGSNNGNVQPATKKNQAPIHTLTAAGTKKPAVSKIASLWRKEVKKPAPAKEEKHEKHKTKTASKRSKDSAKDKSESGIKRSSTYDKLDDAANAPAVETIEPELKEIHPPEVVQRSVWRRTYTISNSEDNFVGHCEIISDAPTMYGSSNSLNKERGENALVPGEPQSAIPKTKGLKKTSMWRRDTDKSKEKEPKIKPEKPEKKRFSLFKRDSESSKAEKQMKKGFIKNDNGVWVKMDGTIVEDNDSDIRKILENDSKTILVTALVQPSQPILPLPPSVSPLSSPTKSQPNAAIVPPFNYKRPEQTTFTTSNSTDQPTSSSTKIESSFSVTESGSSTNVTSKTLTKTEMLLARRRNKCIAAEGKTSQSGSDASLNEDSQEKKSSNCLVTTV